MEPEPVKHNHEVTIALMGKDIEYMKKSTEKIANAIELMDKNFVRHDELAPTIKALDSITEAIKAKADKADHVEFQKALDNKVNNTDFAPIKTVLYRINWILISTVVIGLIALLYKAGK